MIALLWFLGGISCGWQIREILWYRRENRYLRGEANGDPLGMQARDAGRLMDRLHAWDTEETS